MLAFAGLGILLLGGVLAVVAFGGGGGSASGGLISTSACTEQEFPGLKPQHINNPNANVNYNSFPPSSGPHYAQPAPWGIYPDSIKQTILVHNLEHGGIVIQYGNGVSKDDVQKLQSFYQDDPSGLVVAPYDKLGNKIARDRLERAGVRPEPGCELQQGRSGTRVRPHVQVVRQGRSVQVPRHAAQQGRRALPERQGHGSRPVAGGYAFAAGVAKLVIRA